MPDILFCGLKASPLACLLTCLLVSSLPWPRWGRASQETSFSGMCSAPFFFTQAVLLRPAHLVALICLYFLWNFSLFAIALTSRGIAFQVSHPHTEEISSQLHAAMFHSQIEGVCRATSYSLASCFKPLQGVKFSSAVDNFVHHCHFCLVPSFLQSGQP